MTTWFCLSCSSPTDEGDRRCPRCGVATDVSGWTYERKLIAALDHRLPDRRILAARILGRIRARAAVPKLAELATDPTDPYLAAEAVGALAAIEPDHPTVARIRRSGPALSRARLEVSGTAFRPTRRSA